MSLNLITLLAAVAAADVPAPTLLADAIGAQKPAILRVNRVGSDGTVAVYKARKPNFRAPLVAGVSWQGEGNGVATVFDAANLTYVAWSNNNWIVLRNGVPCKRAAAPAGQDQFEISNNGGKIRVTFGAAPSDGDEIVVLKVTVETVLADGTNQVVAKEIVTSYFMWGVTTGGAVSGTTATVEPKKPS